MRGFILHAMTMPASVQPMTVFSALARVKLMEVPYHAQSPNVPAMARKMPIIMTNRTLALNFDASDQDNFPKSDAAIIAESK